MWFAVTYMIDCLQAGTISRDSGQLLFTDACSSHVPRHVAAYDRLLTLAPPHAALCSRSSIWSSLLPSQAMQTSLALVRPPRMPAAGHAGHVLLALCAICPWCAFQPPADYPTTCCPVSISRSLLSISLVPHTPSPHSMLCSLLRLTPAASNPHRAHACTLPTHSSPRCPSSLHRSGRHFDVILISQPAPVNYPLGMSVHGRVCWQPLNIPKTALPA
jgi:hypothetical protein